MEVVKLGLILTIGIIGVFIVWGFVIEELNKLSRQVIYRAFGITALYITSFIGTPVHEFGHYIMCKIFLHKIVEVKWFIPSAVKQGGVLGYVKHGRSNSIYQRIGDFFIGIGPLIVGSIIVISLSRYLLPDTFNEILAISICSHMSLSRADIKNSSFGAISLLVFNMIFAFCIVSTKMNISDMERFLYNYNIICIVLMSSAVIIILFTLIIASIVVCLRRR